MQQGDGSLRSHVEAAEEVAEVAGRNAGLHDAAEASIGLVEPSREGQNPIAPERIADQGPDKPVAAGRCAVVLEEGKIPHIHSAAVAGQGAAEKKTVGILPSSS